MSAILKRRGDLSMCGVVGAHQPYVVNNDYVELSNIRCNRRQGIFLVLWTNRRRDFVTKLRYRIPQRGTYADHWQRFCAT